MIHFLARHTLDASRSYATSMTSVCLSVTLVHYYHIVQQRVTG